MIEITKTFNEQKYVVIKKFVPDVVLKTLERYLYFKTLRYPETNQSFYSEPVGLGHACSSHSWYADPLAEVILENSKNQLEILTNLKLYPTYSYTRIYTKNNFLSPHKDRPPCEISVTCNIATEGGVWPFYLSDDDGAEARVELEPGDAVVYRGCELVHWRDRMDHSEWVVQMMLHYVDANGPNVNFKDDKRPSLGMPFPE
jgi:hypothetical protein